MTSAVLVAIGVAQRIDQQEAGGGLLGLDAEGQHGLRHARLGLLQTVLHVDLGQFGVGPRLEGDGDLGYAVGVAGGLEVQQVLGAVESSSMTLVTESVSTCAEAPG